MTFDIIFLIQRNVNKNHYSGGLFANYFNLGGPGGPLGGQGGGGCAYFWVAHGMI